MTGGVLAFVGLGSNEADPPRQLDAALAALAALPDTQLHRASPRYVTAPFGPVPQPDFLNGVVSLWTSMSPTALLYALHDIEASQGRVRSIRWGPRTLDLDLLLHGDARVASPSLTLPHPGIAQRNFVLYPLRDIAPDLVIPGCGRVSDLAAQVGAEGIRPE
ncbi:MAG: hypothetical protein RLZZ200_1475 [Pseudomonadota bacterium]|jgi:2-amino-4-hydroxy-6-hydroxymethyldihydropteridine diphosphokinase